MTLAAAPQPAASPGPQPGSLLLVDDEQNILAALKRVFRPPHYRALIAASGAEGLEILARERIDLVVSDMRMPGMSGAEFLERVAAERPDVMRILLTGHADLTETVAAINRGHIYAYVSKPWRDEELRLTVQRALETRRMAAERAALLDTIQRQNAELMDLNANLERKVEERVRAIEVMKTMLEQSNRDLKKSLVDTVSVLSSIIETRDGAATGHARRVAEMAHRLAVDMGMDEGEAQEVLFAALLHDIGKVALPDGLIARPFDALTRDERDEVARHPAVGEALLMSLGSMREVARIIRSHLERYDGSGAPDGLAGEAIPLGARIIAVVNDYDALKDGRLLRERLGRSEARRYLADHRGSRYDPRVVDHFLDFMRRQAPAARSSEIVVPPEQLRPGMRLARDVLTRKGMVLLPKGHVMDEQLIAQLRELGRNAGGRLSLCVARD